MTEQTETVTRTAHGHHCEVCGAVETCQADDPSIDAVELLLVGYCGFEGWCDSCTEDYESFAFEVVTAADGSRTFVRND